MSKEKILSLVREVSAPAAASMGLTVWGVELVGAGRPLIRVFVDSLADIPAKSLTGGPQTEARDVPGESFDGDFAADFAEEDGSGRGVTVGQCSELSRLVGLALDVEDIFPDAWELEVSSPGLERTFFHPEQMYPYLGREVDLTLWEPLPEFAERRKFRGELAASGGDAFTLRIADLPGKPGFTDLTFSWSTVRKVRLIHIFPDTSKPGSGKGGKAPKAETKGGGKNK